MKGWGVSVLVGWTDMDDFSVRPIQLIAGRTLKGSFFGGKPVVVDICFLYLMCYCQPLYIGLCCVKIGTEFCRPSTNTSFDRL